jgi:hypothetical protein
MADAKTIQRLPSGLLDLLGMQSTGDTPHLISGEVVPIVDLMNMYLTDRLRGQNAATANVTVVGNLPSTVGPAAGEQWLVYGITGSSTGALAAATGFTANLFINRASTGFVQFITPPYAVANPALWAGGVSWTEPVIMRPGDTVGVWISAVTGAPASGINCTAIYVPLRV